jgi:diguanylate cyclase (GGDEF)-like protein
MTLPTDDLTETLKRKAVIFILVLMSLAAMLATVLHTFESKPHPISLVIPPLTAIACLSLLFYLVKYPQQIYRVIKISIGWSSFILLFPEYFFALEAFLDPKKRLVDTLPPISSGIFLLTTIMIVFLRPRGLVRLAFLLWVVTAAPVVVYLIFHPSELETPRGMDLMITLVPAMGINLSLLLFYSRLQDAIDKLYIERFQLKEASEKDALTSVFNRGAGERILQSLIDRPEQKIGIILCDIDRFKQVNDRYGHLMGDRVLQSFTRCCQEYLRKTDILIRWGGEEFLIVVLGDEEKELEQLAERLRSIVADRQIPEVGKVTASFGAALLQPQENLIQLFARADHALYQAKELGRNQVVLA